MDKLAAKIYLTGKILELGKTLIYKTEIAAKKVISTFRLSNAKETNIVIAAAKANQTVTRAGIINSITVKIIVSINQNT